MARIVFKSYFLQCPNRLGIEIHTRFFRHGLVKMQDTKPPGHRQRSLDYLKLMNFTMTVDETKAQALIHTNGLSYVDFDSRTGKPKPWHLLTFLESARYYSQHWPLEISGRVFRDYAQLTDDRLTFMVSTRLDIETTMYDAKIPKAPLDVVVQGGFIGNCSLNTITTVVTKSSKKLMRNITQVVSIDKTSRRPLPLPDWWKNKYAESAKPHKPLKFSTIEKPKNVPFINYRVVRSDLDSNNHANWSVYVKYSLDAMYHFSKTGYLASFSDFDSFSLSRMDLMYSGESFDDNELQVNAWEENECNHNTVISLILKDNQLLFQGKFKFLKDSQL